MIDHDLDFTTIAQAFQDVLWLLDNIKIVKIFVNNQFVTYSILQLLEAIFGINVMKMFVQMFVINNEGSGT